MRRGTLTVCFGLIAGLAGAHGAMPQAPPDDAPPSVPPPPMLAPPQAKSPVETFRELLAMPREERAKFLETRSPESQKIIASKLREYESLRPDERELRLKSTELRWYLLPLMQAPATNREAQLAMVPNDDRELVAARLKEWDALSPRVQQELLQNEATLQYFTEVNSGAPPTISPARREKLESGLAHWRSLPEDRRREIVLHFRQFFELKPEEQARALENLSPAERRQIQKTLKSFERLPPDQRRQCIESFRKFVGLPLEERQEFLKNAERWKLMSPEERQSWRELVSRLSRPPAPPPGPPGSMPLQTRHAPGPPPPPAPNKTRTNS